MAVRPARRGDQFAFCGAGLRAATGSSRRYLVGARARAAISWSIPGRRIFGFRKFFLSFFRKICLSIAIRLVRGTYASSRTWGGCDGRDGCARRAQSARTAKSCGPDLSTLRSSSRALLVGTRGRWGQESRSPGRARRTPLKPFARGRPGCSGQTCGNCRLLFFLQAGHGGGRLPAFLAPSHFSGGA